MATISTSIEREQAAEPRPAVGQYPADSLRFDLLAVLASAWFLGGLFLDGWAHNHIAQLETFFTPWHGILYSGYFAVAILMAVTQLRNVNKGYAFARALPRGYFWSLVGVTIFFIGGGADFLWHTVLGIEQNVEALFSPPHLFLASGATLFLAGPLRAAWGRKGAGGWRALFPAVMSGLMLFSLFTFFTQYSNIFSNPTLLLRGTGGDDFYFTTTSIVNILIPTALTMGMLLLLIRRWQLPPGAVTLMLTVNASLMVAMRNKFAGPHWQIILAAVAAGLVADGLILWLRPSVTRVTALRIFAFIVPLVLFLAVMTILTLTTTAGLWWEIHMWLGVPFTAGVIGLGLSFLLVPPALPAD
jgi:hypothetical protein